jgi:hypothetical protein
MTLPSSKREIFTLFDSEMGAALGHSITIDAAPIDGRAG